MKFFFGRVPFIYSIQDHDHFVPDMSHEECQDRSASLVPFLVGEEEDPAENRPYLDSLKSRTSDISLADSDDLSSSDLSYRDPVDPCGSVDSDSDSDIRHLDPETKLPLFTLEQVSYHDSYDDCWIILYDKVYDITSFLEVHPAGEGVLMENAGRDATISFRSVGHSPAALKAMEQYLVGILPDHQRIFPADSDCRWSIL